MTDETFIPSAYADALTVAKTIEATLAVIISSADLELDGVHHDLELLASIGKGSPLPSPSNPGPMAASGIHEVALAIAKSLDAFGAQVAGARSAAGQLIERTAPPS